MNRLTDDLLHRPRPLLLDGATGTELERRGYPLEAAGWSARALDEAPELLTAIHQDYADAGAEIVTANTFRLHRRNLEVWGRGDDQARLVQRAIDLARRAVGGRAVVAASLAPLGDCYSPDDVPPATQIEAEHRELATALANAGADLILVETMVAGIEAEAACRAAIATGLPVVVSFVTGPAGQLLTGEPLSGAVAGVLGLGPIAAAVNCVSCSHVAAAMDQLQSARPACRLGVYANTGERGEDGSWRVTTASQPAVYAGIAAGWLERGIGLIGGCCGTTPAHIAALQTLISQRFAK